MAVLRKDVIGPNRVYQKNRNAWVVSADEVAEMNRSVSEIQSRGFRIPVWMEHPAVTDWRSFPIPEEKAEEAEKDPWFVGWVTSGNIGTDGTLNLDFSADDGLAERLKGIGTFVSPQYGQFDKNGPKLRQAVHHLALTRNPVNTHQTNRFTPVEENSKISLDQTPESEQGIRQMSLTDALAVGAPVRFSMNDAVTPSSNPSVGQQSGSNSQQANPHDDAKQRFIEALAALGISVDPNSPIQADSRVLSRLTSMLADMTSDAADRQMQTLQSTTNPNGGTSNGYSQQATVVAMSKTDTNQNVTQPAAPAPQVSSQTASAAVPANFDMAQVVRMSQVMAEQEGHIKTLQAQNAGLMNMVTQQTRKTYQDRINGLRNTGRITADDANALETLATTFQFSATSGDSKSELDIRLEVYEKLPANALSPVGNAALQTVQMSGYTETPVTQTNSQFFSDNEPTDDRAKQILAEFFPAQAK